MVRKVLVPTDGSPTALRAAAYAAALKKLVPEMEITVLTVHTVPRDLIGRKLYWMAAERPVTGEVIEELFAEERERVLKTTADVFREAGVEVRVDHRTGDAAEVIAEYARENGFDLIVMGTRGASEVSNLLIGSVSYKVLHLAHCPVVMVK
ncbi:MAG: universal stress protein [Desulfotomaculales bacterium]